MKRAFTVLGCLLFVIAAGCSSAAPVPVPATTLPSQRPTDTPLPTLTLTPPATFTASPTLYLSPTVTPENWVLAEKGYDIAGMQLSFPREDTVNIHFKYRFDESRKDKKKSISLVFPPQCIDDDNKNWPPGHTSGLTEGEVTVSYKMTLQGVCEADGILFEIRYFSEGPAVTPIYREFVSQPFRLVRDFPTVNSDTLQVENFSFTPGSNWSGEFRFDFHLSEQIPLPLEQYRFSLYGFGPDGSCPFEVRGSFLREHDGQQVIPLYLPMNYLTLYQECPGRADKYTYTASYISLFDLVAVRTVYHHPLNQQFTIFRSQ